MRTSAKIALAIGGVLILIGGLLFTAVMSALNWDFTELDSEEYETTTWEISQEFSSVSINSDTADIDLLPAEDGVCKVIAYCNVNSSFSASVKDSVLSIDCSKSNSLTDHITLFSLENSKLTVYLPLDTELSLKITEDTGDITISEYLSFENIDIKTSTGNIENHASASGETSIKVSTGDITLKDISTGKISLSATTGKINISNVTCSGDVKVKVNSGDSNISVLTCKTFPTDGSTGDITLKNTIAEETCSITRSTGDVILKQSDASEFTIKTSTGDIYGTILSNKIFKADTDSGSVNVPNSAEGGKCSVTTDTGDINIAIGSK